MTVVLITVDHIIPFLKETIIIIYVRCAQCAANGKEVNATHNLLVHPLRFPSIVVLILLMFLSAPNLTH